MIAGGFIMGDTFPIADILTEHCVNWAIGGGFPVQNAGVNAYAKRLRDRSAVKAIRARDTA